MSDRPARALKLPTQDQLFATFGYLIYAIRLGLVPMYLGLWAALIAYNVWFFRMEVEFLSHLQDATGTSFLMWVLGLIDVTMIANLVVMTTIGGYSTFVREFDLEKLVGKPRWMNGLDSSMLKIKTSMSLVIVTGIHLLQTFMEADAATTKAALDLIVGKAHVELYIHLVFVFTTIMFTLNARLMPHHGTPQEHAHQP